MRHRPPNETNAPVAHPLKPALLLLFFGSGCAALIYEIVWFQMLQMVIGSSAVSMAVILGTFMGGMCIGSIGLPRMVSAARHPLRVYALLETGIGLFGILIAFCMPGATWIYAAHVGAGLGGILLRGLFAAIWLLPPTILMGATLPAIARWVRTTPSGISWLGFFYGGNIAGATFGSLLAGFYLLRVHDSVVATFVAVIINALVALTASVVSLVVRYKPQVETEAAPSAAGNDSPADDSKTSPWLVYTAIALSGMAALGAEVVWTRLLSLTLGGTVYTFSVILAVFLFGLGVGSGVGAALARTNWRSWTLLGGCQWLLTAAIAWAACFLSYRLITPSMAANVWLDFRSDLVICLWALLPAALLWGASFPLALAAVRGRDPARLAGGVYAANTVGGIVGGIGFSIIFIPVLGTQQSQRLLVGIATVAALLVFAALAWKSRRSLALAQFGAVILAALLFVPAVLAASITKVPGEVIAYGRYAATWFGLVQVLYVGEGMNSSIAVTQTLNGAVRNFSVSGRVVASSAPQDMRVERMLGDIPALIHPHPRSVLVVGCGAGVTAGSFTVCPGVEKITICELEPLVPNAASTYFREENYGVVNDPRTHIIYDDARHYIITTHQKFDVITSDPIHPRIKGSAALFSQEYFELVKDHLKPGGVVTQWVPLYQNDAEAVKSAIATFFKVFPDGIVWGNEENGKGYDLVLLGEVGPIKINLNEVEHRLAQPEYAALAKSLRDIGFHSAIDVFATYAGRERDLVPWLKGAPINRDRNLRLQYLAGLDANLFHSDRIFKAMIAYRKFPDSLFTGSDENLTALKVTMEKTWAKRPTIRSERTNKSTR